MRAAVSNDVAVRVLMARPSRFAAARKWVTAVVSRLVSGKALVAVSAHLMLVKGIGVIVAGMHLLAVGRLYV